MAWAETLAFVKLPVFGKQISCQFGGLLDGHWPQMMKWNQHPSAEEVTQPPGCEESGSAWCGFAQLPSWRKLYDRDPSGNWGIGGKLGSNTQYTMRGKLLSIDAHLWRNQRCESFEFRCLHSSDVGLGMLFWILSVGPRISGDFTGFSKAHKDLLPTGF